MWGLFVCTPKPTLPTSATDGHLLVRLTGPGSYLIDKKPPLAVKFFGEAKLE
jgi:hypothetical protein